MSALLKSNATYRGLASALPSPDAPMPALASAYLDFRNQLFIARDITTGVIARSTLWSDIITVTRASPRTIIGASGMDEYAANNTPAFAYDPQTLAPRGVHVGAGVTNNDTNSNNFAAGTYTATGVAVASAALAGPDGGTAWLLTESTNNEAQELLENASAAIAGRASVGLRVKALTGTIAQISYSTASGVVAWANYNLRTGKVTRIGGSAIEAVMPLAGNGFYRLCLSAPAMLSGTFRVSFVGDNPVADAKPVYTGTGKTMLIAGLMISAWDGDTALVPTSGATATGAGDVIDIIAGLNTFNPAGGAVYIEAYNPATTQSAGSTYNSAPSLWGFDKDANNYFRHSLRAVSNGGHQVLAAYNGGAVTSVVLYPPDGRASGMIRSIVNAVNGSQWFWDGQSLVTGTLAMSTSFTKLLVGRSRAATGSTVFGGEIAKLVYYPPLPSIAAMKAEFDRMG